MAAETWNEFIKNENQLNDLSKEELIGCVKALLEYAKHSDEVHKTKDELINRWEICAKDYLNLFNEAKPYMESYYNGIGLPFGFYIARAKMKT